jgi:glyoxylase-like metal-dependent hydrolase (beta-lactamase superfamily II)
MDDSWRVDVLLEGNGYSSTCTLIRNDRHRIVVDTGLSIQEAALVRELAERQVAPDDVDLVINTHLHLDHCGNNALFRRAAICMSRPEWDWTREFYDAIFSSRTPERIASRFYPELDSYALPTRTIRNVARMARLFWHPERVGVSTQFRWLESASLPAGLEIMPTPGHTPHHISIRIDGPAATIVAGDAVLNEDADAKVKTMIPFSRARFESVRQALIDRGELIIPGHGRAFRQAASPARRV